jgi:hypothetical protein
VIRVATAGDSQVTATHVGIVQGELGDAMGARDFHIGFPRPNAGQGLRHAARAEADGRESLLQIDDGRLLNQLPVWAPDSGIRKKVLADNPVRLYAF